MHHYENEKGERVATMTCGQPDATTEKMLPSLAAKIYETVEHMIGDDIYHLRLSECRNGESETTYAIEISNHGLNEAEKICCFVSAPEAGVQLFATEATQDYFAENTEKPQENYAGYATVSVVMYGEVDKKKTGMAADLRFAPNCLAESLIGIALYHYYRETVKWYPEWRTQYLNAPVVDSYKIDRI